MPDGATTGLLISRSALGALREDVARIERESGARFEPVFLPDTAEGRLDRAELERVDIAFFSGDVFPDRSRAFFAAVQGATRLRWLHIFHAGTDHPVYRRLLERGVAITNSPEANATAIAQTAIGGLLMLARGFLRWGEAQRKREWLGGPRGAPAPADLADQTLVVIGVGAIGSEIARLARALGLRVVGVRRSPRAPDDPVDEMHPPDRLPELLPRADWLAIACPLTDETRRLIDAAALARLPRGARVLNVGRGPILDESALIDALRDGRVGGAYLDVFEVEPLPVESPLWDLPNAILTPHASSFSAGNRGRQLRAFAGNLQRWARGEPLARRVE